MYFFLTVPKLRIILVISVKSNTRLMTLFDMVRSVLSDSTELTAPKTTVKCP